jgi:hypothetical protein
MIGFLFAAVFFVLLGIRGMRLAMRGDTEKLNKIIGTKSRLVAFIVGILSILMGCGVATIAILTKLGYHI